MSQAMNDHAAARPVVAVEATMTTPSGKVAFVARHRDGRNVAMMAPKDVTTHEQMVAMAEAAFAAQPTGTGPS